MFQALKKIFTIKPKKFLGIDIGTSFIRVVEIEKHGQDRQLDNYGDIESSSFRKQSFRTSKKNTFSLSNKIIAEAILAILSEAEIQTKEVNFSIPDFCSFFTSFNLPVMSKEEIPEAIRYHVRPLIPLPLEEIALDWSIIEGQISKTPLKVLVVAIPREVVLQYQEIAEFTNLKSKFLESEVFALTKSLSENKEIKKVISLVDIGSRSSTCNIVEGKTLKTSYSFNIAGNELTEAIVRSLNVKYNEAEILKKKYGLAYINEPKEIVEESQNRNLFGKDVSKILVPLTDLILEEIKKVFRDFYRKEGKEVDKVILSGGVALMPGLRDYFANELKKEVVKANPFLGISYPPTLATTLESIGPVYGVAVGLALKGLE